MLARVGAGLGEDPDHRRCRQNHPTHARALPARHPRNRHAGLRLRPHALHNDAATVKGRRRHARRLTATHPGCMAAPIIAHRPSPTGGRRITVGDEILGLAHSDGDVLEFLRRAGLPDAEELLDDPRWVEWRGGRAHHYEAA